MPPAWFSALPPLMKLMEGPQEPLESFLLPDDVLAIAFCTEEDSSKVSKTSKKRGAKGVAAKETARKAGKSKQVKARKLLNVGKAMLKRAVKAKPKPKSKSEGGSKATTATSTEASGQGQRLQGMGN